MTLESKIDAMAKDVKAIKERTGASTLSPLATVKEAAAFTKLSERTIWKGIERGMYTPYRNGKSVRVSLKQILDAMEQEAVRG